MFYNVEPHSAKHFNITIKFWLSLPENKTSKKAKASGKENIPQKKSDDNITASDEDKKKAKSSEAELNNVYPFTLGKNTFDYVLP